MFFEVGKDLGRMGRKSELWSNYEEMHFKKYNY